MSRYDDYRRSTGALSGDSDRWDAGRFARERQSRLHSRGPPVLDRPPRVEDDRFEYRLQEHEPYGPPARRPGRHYEDDHLIPPAGPLVAYDRRHAESPPLPPRPRLMRRQSSLDTFDRIPSRKIDEYYYHEPAPRAPPSPPPSRTRSVRQSREHDIYDDIRIAEPDYYGDEEYHFRDVDRPRRSNRRLVEEVEIDKPYPRKGKTRLPRKLVHHHAVRALGYPFEQEGDTVIIQLALSKEQIDEVISRSRQIKRRSDAHIIHPSPSPVRERHRARNVERLAMEPYVPRASHDTLLIERSPSRHRSRSRHYDYSEKKVTRTVSRARSISVHGRRRRSSPVRMVDRHDHRVSSDKVNAGPLALMVRPRTSEDDLQELMELQRRGRKEVRHTEFINGDGDYEEIQEVKRDRKGPNSRILRAMMATLT